MNDRAHLTNPAKRLPDLRLPPVAGGAPVSLLPARKSSVVVLLVHDVACAGCRAYIERTHAEKAEFASWDCDVVVITARAPEGKAPGRFTVLVDAENQLARALAIEPAALLVADQWGQVHEAWISGDAHDFPEPSALIEWARYLATVCPECEGEAL